MPGQKARPAPLMITAATESSCCTARSASVSAFSTSAFSALSLAGRFKVRSRTAPRVSVSNTSSKVRLLCRFLLSDVQGLAQRPQAGFVEGLAERRVGVDGAADVFQPRAHL